MSTVNDVRDALSARSRTATLEQLASEGKKRVRLIKAEHVAAMISASVHSAIEQSGLIPKEEVEKLVENSRSEFRSMLQDRQQEVQRIQELEDLVEVREREIVELRHQLEAARTAPGGGAPAAGGAAATAAGGAAAIAGAPDLSAALEKLAGSLNDRLEKLGKKMGISSAVEGDEVNFDGLFKDTGKELESNMENIQVKKKAGGGIAANLERLKKLKGGG
ncbi:MAG: hypothetical protein AB7O97_01365 [Planctomycetota bacterium]